FNSKLINQFSDSQFQDVLDTISNKSNNNQNDWEIRKGNTLLLDNNQNQFELAVGLPRLEQELKEGDFSLGQALTGYWLIEDELNDLSQAHEQIPYYSAMKNSMDLISTLESDNDLKLTNTQQSLIFLTSNRKQNITKQTISLNKPHETFNQDLSSDESSKDTPSSLDPISSNETNSSIDWLNTKISQPNLSQQTFQLNQSNFFQHQVFLHHLFSQLSQQKKLRYYDGKAILSINDETLVAQLNEQNQWEYVSGTLSQTSLNELQYELNSSQSIRHSSSSQSSDLTL
ncbi:MAG: hypothetical protein WBM32_17865, partial [Crocosphaera sp.]